MAKSGDPEEPPPLFVWCACSVGSDRLTIGQSTEIDFLADTNAVVTQDRVGRCDMEIKVRDEMLDQVFVT